MTRSNNNNSQRSDIHRERGTTAYIHTNHITHNLNVFKQLHSGKIIAVVKADAYGHRLKHVVPALKACDAFAVATIEEALELRALDEDKKILLLEGVFNSNEMNVAVEKQFDVVVHQDFQIRLLAEVDHLLRLDVWLKIDTGMSRLGFHADEVIEKLAELNSMDQINTIRLMSHFASSEAPKCLQTQGQLELNTWLKTLGLECSFSNTGGVLNKLSDDGEWARVGLGLFGISPLKADAWGNDFDLKPAMHLTAKIIATKTINVGSQVGYGGNFTVENETRIAVLGIGYADGYPWSEHSSFVLIDGIKAPVIGRVSMDMMTIDVSDFKGSLTGKEVTVWGGDLPAESVASDLNLIPYSLVCGIKNRVKKNVVQ